VKVLTPTPTQTQTHPILQLLLPFHSCLKFMEEPQKNDVSTYQIRLDKYASLFCKLNCYLSMVYVVPNRYEKNANGHKAFFCHINYQQQWNDFETQVAFFSRLHKNFFFQSEAIQHIPRKLCHDCKIVSALEFK